MNLGTSNYIRTTSNINYKMSDVSNYVVTANKFLYTEAMPDDHPLSCLIVCIFSQLFWQIFHNHAFDVLKLLDGRQGHGAKTKPCQHWLLVLKILAPTGDSM